LVDRIKPLPESSLLNGRNRLNSPTDGKADPRILTSCRWDEAPSEPNQKTCRLTPRIVAGSAQQELRLTGLRALLTAAALIFASPLLQAADWTPLFDGRTTQGWTPRAEVVSFEARNGELHILSKKNVWITSDVKMGDFIVEAEVKLPKGAEGSFNSGVAFRCIGEKGKPKGYQCEIDARRPTQSGGVYGIGLGGWLYPKNDQKKEFNAKIKGVFKYDDWNKVRVRCEGPRIQTWINGKLIADVKDSKSLKGYFGIQHHGKGGTVKFRNLRAKRLN